MTDVLGYRSKVGIVIPSIATVPQPEMEAMRPAGVTNHISRVHVPPLALDADSGHAALMQRMRLGTMDAIDAVMTCAPDHLILCTSGDTVRGGPDAARVFQSEIERRAGRGVSMPGFALDAALRALLRPTANEAAIGLLTPYQPAGDRDSIAFFRALGYSVARIEGLALDNPLRFAQQDAETLRAALDRLDGPDLAAIVQMGTNLPFAALAAAETARRGKPVIALNTALYWHALRALGIADRVRGFGPLLARY